MIAIKFLTRLTGGSEAIGIKKLCQMWRRIQTAGPVGKKRAAPSTRSSCSRANAGPTPREL